MEFRFVSVNVQKNIIQSSRIGILILCAAFITGFVGCKQWNGFGQTRQYQVESERLLTEFRAQKQRAEQLAIENDKLASRLAESEKMVARLQNNGSQNRLAGNRNGAASSFAANRASDPSSLGGGAFPRRSGSEFPGRTVSTGQAETVTTGPIKWRRVGPK